MTTLNAARRRADLESLVARAEPVDVLVIGGGITGVGIALDAATRGLSVALVEAHDLAFGTSRWSSKLVHGGLRYLASGDVGIAHESAVERHHLMTTIAPHLIRPVRQVVPDFGNRTSDLLVRAGFRAGDVLRRIARTPADVLPGPKRLSSIEVIASCPTVRRHGLRGGASTTDGQLIDDARLVTAVARTAAGYGAQILTRVRVLRADGTGAVLRDELDDREFHVAARSVVNATGVWASDIDSTLSIRPSRGTHLVFDAEKFGNPTAALTVQIPGSTSRFVFVLPEQLGRVYLGLTDVDADGPVPDVPTPDDDEIDFLLNTVNTALAIPVTRADIRGAFSGLRPLIDTAGGDGSTLADVSRRHDVRVTDGSLVSVVGGKLTTYRQMAEDAVDAAVKAAGLTAATGCVTPSIALVGASAADRQQLAGLPASLVARFGAEAPRVVEAATVAEPLAPIADGIDVTRAEIEFAFTHEGALSVDDVLDRRTRIGLVAADADRARPAVEQIAASALV
ncbi:glycerol-3-phosphate dehydrogenase [Gordonia araii NBRC 100433]|uniref:Glycerol-3-phosphate dehydrogenase n=1 Tax=Gordonia araii NBRC 100433 TaxID=1073574 RepID=G7H6I3_9ACTN|nr:glycerol-3-phosphate dehydrogenase/oxidase [Gordonia araii]NNG96138.1 glycerol-3-phosphate dehydrogenase/oxidase [Gordonia araii NBRC 100433]GAB11458.1 glycerol-3-phosphate dehydrogenase [Gordonia araii NBRC 100433]